MIDNTHLVIHHPSNVGSIHLAPRHVSDSMFQNSLEFLIEERTAAQSTYAKMNMVSLFGLIQRIVDLTLALHALRDPKWLQLVDLVADDISDK